MDSLNLTADEFQQLAARIIAMASEYYAQLPDARTYPEVCRDQIYNRFNEPLPEVGMHGSALDALQNVMQWSRPPGARFFGYVLGSGEPVAALADLLASVLNQNVTAWRSAPAAVNQSATDLVTRLHVTPQDNPTSRSLKDGGDQNLAALTKLKGAAFDRAYVDHEVAYHQAVLDAVDKTLIPSAQNADLKALPVTVRPAFVAHLDHAKSIQTSLAKTSG